MKSFLLNLFTRLSFFCFFTLMLSGCAHLFNQNATKDFSDIPHHEYFIEAYTEDKNNQLEQTLNNYMLWVGRFYYGWLIYDTGWLETTKKVLDKIEDPTEKMQIAEKMEMAGKRVSSEWAKDNKHGTVTAKTLSNLAESLKEASSRNQVSWFLDEALKDIASLKARELAEEDIQIERYFPDLVSDDDWGSFF